MKWTNTTITLGQLKPWSDNPKTSSKKDARALLKSWDELGQFQTIAIGPGGEVYDGHQRLSALLTAHGADYVVEARQADRALTDEERRKIALYSRQIGAWDWDALSNWQPAELMEWGGFDADTLKDWKRDVAALDNFLKSEKPEPADAEAQIDRAEELRALWGVELGQMWQLGEHRLICGDCTDRAVVERVMGGEKAGACVTDPPYGINREGITNDDPEGLRALFDGCLAAMPIDDGVLIAFQSPRLEWVWLDATRAAGWHPERLLWMYRTGQAAYPWRGWYMRSDTIRVASIGNPEWPKLPEAATDCYTVNINDTETVKATSVGGMSSHSTIKPIDVVQDLAQHTTGDIYDPFLGSGTTLIACERLNRRCRAVEISLAYCAVALQRWVDLTGKTPVLIP